MSNCSSTLTKEDCLSACVICFVVLVSVVCPYWSCVVFRFLFSKQGYKDALMEVQALRVNCSTEFKRREALESHITDLKKG